mgnify:CR=1 FL=1
MLLRTILRRCATGNGAAATGSLTGASFFDKADDAHARPGSAGSSSAESQIKRTTRSPPDVDVAPATTATTADALRQQVDKVPHAVWMMQAARAAMGSEFSGVEDSKFLQILPNGFLTSRATTDVQPAEALLADHVARQRKTYDGVDVRDPSTVSKYDGDKPRWITTGDQVRAVSEFISGHIAHHVALPAWQELFDLKHVEMDLMYWLWVLHLHMVSRRATSVPIAGWNRRREVLDELLYSMKLSWIHTSEEVMGRPPLSRIRSYIRDMYLVTACNLEEALMHDGPGGDLMLMSVLMKFCPLPRPEDVPMFTYYTLVHYVRFHVALLDRVSDEDIAKGNFNFLQPDDPSVFKRYADVDFDRVIRGWKASRSAAKEEDRGEGGTSERTS